MWENTVTADYLIPKCRSVYVWSCSFFRSNANTHSPRCRLVVDNCLFSGTGQAYIVLIEGRKASRENLNRPKSKAIKRLNSYSCRYKRSFWCLKMNSGMTDIRTLDSQSEQVWNTVIFLATMRVTRYRNLQFKTSKRGPRDLNSLKILYFLASTVFSVLSAGENMTGNVRIV
jgi:hypothetical protein